MLSVSNSAAARRLFSKTSIGDECWEWQGFRDKGGYGKVRFAGKQYRAPRFAYLIFNGVLTKNVLHRCDNPACVRPDHLFEGTTLDNNRDRSLKGRSVKGEASPWSKLTADQVFEMRRMYLAGFNILQLARAFKVCRPVVKAILLAKQWKHLGIKPITLRLGIVGRPKTRFE